MGKKWVPLESNPEVLTQFASKLGIDTSKYSFTDIYGLDPDLLAMVPKPVLAVIMCFPITEKSEATQKKEDEEQAAIAAGGGIPPATGVLYMKQTIGNACGTIAVLHSLCNNTAALAPEAGSFVDEFLKATEGMTWEARGKYLEEPPEGGPNIEAAHQAAAAVGDTAPPSEDEEVALHFVAFVHQGGHLWQLDGRRAGPVYHGSTSADTLLEDAAGVVAQFVARAEGSVNFNLIALAAAGGDD
eukprot:CAMPEP_0202860686 /NCGR_PEP_ID=MMETSP1391-20130828/2315_1 /ASSEMBLY_ACC=CAM_ASM_000867 /TAXON_ID=1034604 /ORGANISM="Chlamydomonas leiostraca, Strain SAG 11-49" /LENGTH=242 /DNA_ID=CAMNT_0049539909 /DNA_START=41 /DNA_END=769 /DNA_ORIENTATION=+